MTFSPTSWFIKYWVYLPATLLDWGYIPCQTNLCKFFWQTVLVAPLFVIGVIILGPIFALGAGIFIGLHFLGTFVGKYISFPRWLRRFFEATGDGVSVVYEYGKAKKAKVCPIITIIRKDD